MVRSWSSLIGKAVAVLCVLAAIGAVFFASPEQLMKNGGVRNSGGGDIFRGLTALLGDLGARLFVGGLLMGMGVLFWKASSEHTSKTKVQAKRRSS